MAKPFLFYNIKLTDQQFDEIAAIVYAQCGIHLSPIKKIMVESRLLKRLRILELSSFSEYLDLVKGDHSSEELVNFIDTITTNKTDFFREPEHFNFMQQELLPSLFAQSRKATVWSSACSTGEEPYTLAMVLQEFSNSNPGFNYSILASDISTAALAKAAKAIYPMDRAQDIPLELKKKYLLKSKDAIHKNVRIVEQLRQRVQFNRINLVEDAFSTSELFDIIFCRNVLIYFDRKTQINVVNKLLSKLKKGGHLFIGHSESLFQFQLPIQQIRPTIYIKI